MITALFNYLPAEQESSDWTCDLLIGPVPPTKSIGRQPEYETKESL